MRAGQLAPEERFAHFRDRLTEIRNRFPEITGHVDTFIARVIELDSLDDPQIIVNVDTADANAKLDELNAKLAGIAGPVVSGPHLLGPGALSGGSSSPVLVAPTVAPPRDPVVTGRVAGLVHQPIDARRYYSVETVVAQDPNAVMAELERRQRMANLAGG